MNRTQPVPFHDRVAEASGPLTRASLDVVQVNLGKVCNQTCRHCHVDASPFRTETMAPDTAQAVLALLDRVPARTLDITGGAPELHAVFRDLVVGARARGLHVLDRCNLTILSEPGHEDLGDFLADHDVEVVASLPCYLEDNVDTQRGEGVFQRSLFGLKRLNALGYGTGGARRLNLVYNPVGAHLPPDQAGLEATYRRILGEQHGIVFDRLFTITNMPIARFAGDLKRQGQLEAYRQTLLEAFNPGAIDGLMCRHQLSIGWDGTLYDCDFNQMLDMALSDDGAPLTVRDVMDDDLLGRPILTRDHCYGCTAGAGSSCGGALA